MEEHLKELDRLWKLTGDWEDLKNFSIALNRVGFTKPGCQLCESPTFRHTYSSCGIRTCEPCLIMIWEHIDPNTLDNRGREALTLIKDFYKLDYKPPRRNPESDLRQAEEQLNIEPSLANLFAYNQQLNNYGLPLKITEYVQLLKDELETYLKSHAKEVYTQSKPVAPVRILDQSLRATQIKTYQLDHGKYTIRVFWHKKDQSIGEVRLYIQNLRLDPYTEGCLAITGKEGVHPDHAFYMAFDSATLYHKWEFVNPLTPWLYDVEEMVTKFVNGFAAYAANLVPNRRNPESDLRQAEEQLELEPSLANFYHLNSQIKKHGLPFDLIGYAPLFRAEMDRFIAEAGTTIHKELRAFSQETIFYYRNHTVQVTYYFIADHKIGTLLHRTAWGNRPIPEIQRYEIRIAILNDKADTKYEEVTLDIRELSSPTYVFFLNQTYVNRQGITVYHSGSEDASQDLRRTLDPLTPWLYDVGLILDHLITAFDQFLPTVPKDKRRNPESDLRQVEEQYRVEPSLENLQKLNIIRSKYQIPPEFEDEYNFQMLDGIAQIFQLDPKLYRDKNWVPPISANTPIAEIAGTAPTFRLFFSHNHNNFGVKLTIYRGYQFSLEIFFTAVSDGHRLIFSVTKKIFYDLVKLPQPSDIVMYGKDSVTRHKLRLTFSPNIVVVEKIRKNLEINLLEDWIYNPELLLERLAELLVALDESN